LTFIYNICNLGMSSLKPKKHKVRTPGQPFSSCGKEHCSAAGGISTGSSVAVPAWQPWLFSTPRNIWPSVGLTQLSALGTTRGDSPAKRRHLSPAWYAQAPLLPNQKTTGQWSRIGLFSPETQCHVIFALIFSLVTNKLGEKGKNLAQVYLQRFKHKTLISYQEW